MISLLVILAMALVAVGFFWLGTWLERKFF